MTAGLKNYLETAITKKKIKLAPGDWCEIETTNYKNG